MTENFDGFCRRQWADFSYRLPEGESLGQVQRRNVDALETVLRQYAGKNIAIGSHGTALSTLIRYYDPTFGYEDFRAIQHLMPWVVTFRFESGNLLEMEKINVFALS